METKNRIDRRSFHVVLAVLFAATTLVAPAAAASETACRALHESEPTRTFDIKVRAGKAIYRRGETARFQVTVTRVVQGQVVGPAEGARVALFVMLGRVTLVGGSVTNAQGEATVKVRLRRFAPTGVADVIAFAEKEIADLPCHTEYEREFGRVDLSALFKVAR